MNAIATHRFYLSQASMPTSSTFTLVDLAVITPQIPSLPMFHRILRPEFIHRPSQLFRAALQKCHSDPKSEVTCKLPWRSPLTVNPSDYVGHRVYRHGLIALEACEAAFRLLRPGDRAIDAGANIGTVTSAMACRVGQSGSVVSIEMLPETFGKLVENVAGWGSAGNSVELVNSAVSDRSGTIRVGLSEDFEKNSGVAYATHGTVPGHHSVVHVPCVRLDDIIDGKLVIKLLKIDVERHEYQALLGAGRLISDHRVENIIFEDCSHANTQAKQLLESAGYRIYSFATGLRKPRITPWRRAVPSEPTDSDAYSDFIATVNSQDLEAAFAATGYKCLA